MLDNPLMNFLVKRAYTPGINDRILAPFDIINNWKDAIANREYNAELAAAEAANAAGKQKLLHFYETGEGYEPLMDPHIASHFGVKAEDLKDPRVLNRIYRRFKGVPNKILQGLEQEGSAPAMGLTGTRWNSGGSALNSNYRDAILKRIENYAAQKSADDFANAASSSLNELGQYSGAENADIPALNIEDPDLVREQANSISPVTNTRMPEVVIDSPVVNPIVNPADKNNYTNLLNKTQTQINQEKATPKVEPLAITAHTPPSDTVIDVADFNKPYSLEDARAITEEKLSATAPASTPTQNPLAETTINIADYNKPYGLDDARAIVAQGLDGKPATPAATGVTNSTAVSAEMPSATPAVAARDAAGVPTSASTPAQPAQAQKPTGLTREETMQFLEQGYVPTSVGGYALNEQKAADTLRAMQQNPNLNPGAVITDADRLNRIRTTMLGNEQHTAQGRQLEADMAALNDYEYHQKHMAQQNAVPDAQATAYGNNVYNDIHDEIMRKGKNQAMRRVGGGEAYAGEAADRQRLGLPANTPITPEEQYYNKYIEAENNGTALPKLPDAYNRQYNRQLAQYRGQLRPSAPAQTSVRPRHHNYMTGQEMNDYVASQRGNIVENNWKSLSPERQAAARQARADRQAARRNGVAQQATASVSTATTNPLNKTASIRKSLINPFLR